VVTAICQANCTPLTSRLTFVLCAVVVGGFLVSCGSVVSGVSGYFSASLSSAMLNQEDSELVREALPADMLLLDSLIDSYPDVVPDGSLLVSDDRRGAIYRISYQAG
jgi:hypothetical protein